MKLCTDLNFKPRLSMTKRLSPLHILKFLSASTGAGDVPHFLISLYKKMLSFPEILCIKELSLCQNTKCLESHNGVSRADKAVRVAEEALGDERQAGSCFGPYFCNPQDSHKGQCWLHKFSWPRGAPCRSRLTAKSNSSCVQHQPSAML